jgi:hypothetical protein
MIEIFWLKSFIAPRPKSTHRPRNQTGYRYLRISGKPRSFPQGNQTHQVRQSPPPKPHSHREDL